MVEPGLATRETRAVWLWRGLGLALLIAAFAVFVPVAGALAVGGAALLLVLVWAPRLLLYVTVAATVLQDALLHLPPPLSSLDILDDLMVVGLSVPLLAGALLRDGRIRGGRIGLPILAFLVVGAVGWAVNQTAPLYAALVSPRDYVFHFLLLFAFLQFEWSVSRLRRVVLLLYALLALHCGALAVEWAWHYAQTGDLFLEDLATGLMGPHGAHKLGYFCGTVGLVALAGFRSDPPSRVLHGAALLASGFGLLLSSARGAYFAVPVAAVLGSMWSVRGKRATLRLAGTIVVLAIALAAGQWLVRRLPGFGSATVDPVVLARQQLALREGGAGRIGFVLYSVELAGEGPAPMVGRGPASYTSKTGFRFGGAITGELSNAFTSRFVTYPSVGVVVVEYGWLGLALLALLSWQLLNAGRRVGRVSPGGLGWIGEGTSGAVFVFILASFFENALEIQQLTGMIATLAAASVVLADYWARDGEAAESRSDDT